MYIYNFYSTFENCVSLAYYVASSGSNGYIFLFVTFFIIVYMVYILYKMQGKVHLCTGIEALYSPYSP